MSRRILRRACGVWLWSAVVVASSASAQPAQTGLQRKSLEELMAIEVESVTGASKHGQLVTEAPSSVTIVTAADIETFGWRTLADVLASVRGFYVTYDRNYAYVGVRGFGRPTDYNNRILVLIDGHRVNDPIYDGAMVGTDFPIDMALADRIEIIRGPGSALYGTSAFFAVINVITRRGATVDGAEISADAGSLGTYRARAAYGWSNGANRDVLLSLTRYSRRGPHELYFPEFDTADTNGGRVRDRDGDASLNAYASASLGRWRLQGLWSTRDKDVPTASWDTTFGDPRMYTRDTRGWIDGLYSRDTKAGSLAARMYYDQYVYTGSYPHDTTMERDAAESSWVGGEVSLRRTEWRRHHLTFGVEPKINLREYQYDADDETVYVDDHRSTREIGAYVQDEITLHPRLTATIGGRYDWWNIKGGTGRPRVGLVYRANYDRSLKVLYGAAYRAPTLYELFYGAGAVERRADALGPESLQTVEVVFEQYVKGRLRLTATGYHTRITNLIDQVQDDEWIVRSMNQEQVRSRGIELEAERRWDSGFLVRGSYAGQQAIDCENQTLTNAPHHLGTVQLMVPSWRRRMQVAMDATYTSSRWTTGRTELPGYWLAHLTTTYRPLTSHLTYGVSVHNLFNTRYSHPVGHEFVQDAIRQDGRTAVATVGLRF